jgi:PPIC-type PPIASE domain
MRSSKSRTYKRFLVSSGIIFSFLILTAFTTGCFWEKKIPEDAIAIVGDKALTPNDVTRRLLEMDLDPDDHDLRAQVVNRWVDRQILLHEAVRIGLHKDKLLKKRLEELREELLINNLLQETIQVDEPNDDDVVAYWEKRTGEFTRVSNEVKLVIAYTDTRNRAWGIRNGIDNSISDKQLVESYRNTEFDTTSSLAVDRLPREISRAIEPLRSGQASLPFEMDGRWCVVKLIEKSKARSSRPLDALMPSLRARVYADARSQERSNFISALRREARRNGIVEIKVPSDMIIGYNESVLENDSTSTSSLGEE